MATFDAIYNTTLKDIIEKGKKSRRMSAIVYHIST